MAFEKLEAKLGLEIVGHHYREAFDGKLDLPVNCELCRCKPGSEALEVTESVGNNNIVVVCTDCLRDGV